MFVKETDRTGWVSFIVKFNTEAEKGLTENNHEVDALATEYSFAATDEGNLQILISNNHDGAVVEHYVTLKTAEKLRDALCAAVIDLKINTDQNQYRETTSWS